MSWHWSTDPLVLVPLLLVNLLYAQGIVRLWRRAGAGRGVSAARVLAFALGLIALFAALVSPLDVAGELSFALHMTQHMLLVVVAAPLLALGRPGVVLLAVLPARLRRPSGRTIGAARVRHARGGLYAVPLATALHGATIWLWHAPGLYEAALRHPFSHWLEHLTMLATGVVFWWSCFESRRRSPLGHGAGVAALFLTMLHTGVLGILITLAGQPLYATYGGMQPVTGLSPLEDQQVAGIIMLLPGSIAYVGAGLALLAAWLRSAGGASRARLSIAD
jgi:putative membrane protein